MVNLGWKATYELKAPCNAIRFADDPRQEGATDAVGDAITNAVGCMRLQFGWTAICVEEQEYTRQSEACCALLGTVGTVGTVDTARATCEEMRSRKLKGSKRSSGYMPRE